MTGIEEAKVFVVTIAKKIARSMLGPFYTNYLRMRRRAYLTRQYKYDLRRFATHANNGDPVLDRQNLSALITMDYHRIEKGLALPEPRTGFGRDVVKRLVTMTLDFEHRFGSTLATERARAALAEYADFHRPHGAPDDLSGFLTACDRPGGTREVRREDIILRTHIDFEAFVRARHSIRIFTGAPVDPEIVRLAVELAIRSPSVCNRQSGRVRAIFDHDLMAKALSYQNGNRGYGHLAGAILVVTSDLRSFVTSGERNQCWIDGGLFAMTLNYALHAQGVGSCMLNWSANSDRDIAMREAVGIPDHEVVIMMMAVGHMPAKFRVATSAREGVEEVLTIVTTNSR